MRKNRSLISLLRDAKHQLDLSNSQYLSSVDIPNLDITEVMEIQRLFKKKLGDSYESEVRAVLNTKQGTDTDIDYFIFTLRRK